MTSNVGSEEMTKGKFDENTTALVEQKLKAAFKPEFLNRLDAIVFFKPLSKEHLREIVKLRLKEVEEKLSEQGISMRYTDKAVDYLADRGYDPVYGARPIRRLVERDVEGQIADMIISGELSENDVVVVGADDFGIKIYKEE